MAMTQAAINVIQLYRRFFRERVLTIYWQAVENLFSAGTALMFGFVRSPSVRETMTFRMLETLVHTCSSVLWGMVEHFPAFQGKRDAFDMAASKTLSDLSSRFPTAVATEGLPVRDESHLDGRSGSQIVVGGNYSTAREEADTLPDGLGATTPHPAFMNIESNDPRRSHQLEAGQSNHYTSLVPLDFTDLENDLGFVWEATTNVNGYFSPTWI